MKRSSQESFFDSSFSAWGMEHHMAPVLHRLPYYHATGPAGLMFQRISFILEKKHQSILDRAPQISKDNNKYSGHSIVLLIYSMISPLYHHQIIISHVTLHLFPLKALGFRLPSSLLLGAGLLPMALHGAWDMDGMLDDAGVEHELPIPKVPWILCNCIYIYTYVCVRVIFHYYYS